VGNDDHTATVRMVLRMVFHGLDWLNTGVKAGRNVACVDIATYDLDRDGRHVISHGVCYGQNRLIWCIYTSLCFWGAV
jgi:hypothetical protein